MDQLGFFEFTVLWLCKTNLMLKRNLKVSENMVPEREAGGGRGIKREISYLSFD